MTQLVHVSFVVLKYFSLLRVYIYILNRSTLHSVSRRRLLIEMVFHGRATPLVGLDHFNQVSLLLHGWLMGAIIQGEGGLLFECLGMLSVMSWQRLFDRPDYSATSISGEFWNFIFISIQANLYKWWPKRFRNHFAHAKWWSRRFRLLGRDLYKPQSDHQTIQPLVWIYSFGNWY